MPVDFSGKTVVLRLNATFSTGSEPTSFAHGIEILNDDQTPMDFVVETLKLYLGLDHHTAVGIMLAIHKTGRIVVAVPGKSDARRISRAINASAKHHSHPLVCRPYGTN